MKEQKPVNTSDFLEETIKIRPVNRKRIFRRVAEVGALAVLFGLIAYITMAVSSQVLAEKLFPQPTNKVTFAEETGSYTKEEVEPEDMLLEDRPEVEVTVIQPDSETQIISMAYALEEKAKECEKWLVEVAGVSRETSWLDSTATNANIAAGAIVADNGTELLVLVQQKYVEYVERIEVSFADGTAAEGTLKGADKNSGLAVIAVNKGQLSANTLESCEIVEMASSNNKSLLGNVVMALGSPNGIRGSVCYGIVTAMGVEVNAWDYNYRLVVTDIYGCTNPNGFLVNMKGQLVGVLCNTYNAQDTKNLVSALGISEIKKRMELISNNRSIPVFGVKGIEVTEEAHTKNNVPYGAYVTSVKMDSPAMIAGIQAGDVVVKVQGKDISTMYSLAHNLLQLEVGQEIEMVIMRQSQGVYKEITLHITLGAQ